ncbi:MAG: UDP-N-acetylglucosamine--N-acetylmuramyl-(pentapeptide) pyrophosphoryl-undecaprenol N-acetylglucosamine transferase, partial [Bacteroidales bacterium]|nr:UDP-N-acetylglucosamine--N-acetylmuramyl-(pentapeptide) pyrophosphoryl-undecaprenol N-acetylglucosamine transferase [Bacteroidales bacterium]
DHQTKNARTLVQEEAAVLLTDAEARIRLVETAISLIQQPEVLETLKKNIHTLAMPDAANRIVDELEKIVGI